jgi:hypothetical protein
VPVGIVAVASSAQLVVHPGFGVGHWNDSIAHMQATLTSGRRSLAIADDSRQPKLSLLASARAH